MSYKLSKQQILDMKYHANALAESALVTYWAQNQSDIEYHESNMIESLKVLIELSRGVELNNGAIKLVGLTNKGQV